MPVGNGLLRGETRRDARMCARAEAIAAVRVTLLIVCLEDFACFYSH